jgi:DNA repair photolyase
MVKIMQTDRKSAVLTPSSLACLAHIPSVNLTSGCAHRCIYCYARGYSIFPGDNNIVIYKNVLEKLKNELLHKKNKPQAVYFSPSSDIFQPIPEVLDLTHTILEFLLSKNIGIAFVTKGKIPEKTLALLLHHADMVRAQTGIITCDDSIRSVFEPNAASIDIRINQMSRMVAGGIVVEARLVPILPGITDEPDSIDDLFAAISITGVKRSAISTLFLRPSIVASLKRGIHDKRTLNDLLSLYKAERRLAVSAEHSSIVPLSRQKRDEIYTRFRQVAQKYEVELSICGCMNPDIGGTCNITGKWPEYGSNLSLFDQEI